MNETSGLQDELAELSGVHLVISGERATPAQIVDQIRSARPDKTA